MYHLYRGQILKCTNGKTAILRDIIGENIVVEYNGKTYTRPISIIGTKLFVDPKYARPYKNTASNKKENKNTSTTRQNILSKNTHKKSVRIGTTVRILDIETGLEEKYTILPILSKMVPKRMGGAYYGTSYRKEYYSEANPESGTISCQSIVGKSLLNKQVGEIIDIKLPDEIKKVKILKII